MRTQIRNVENIQFDSGDACYLLSGGRRSAKAPLCAEVPSEGGQVLCFLILDVCGCVIYFCFGLKDHKYVIF